MCAAEAPLLSPASPATASVATLLDRQLAMLDELAEIAMEVARSVGRQAAEDQGASDLTLAFSRAARAVRLTLLLQTRLVEGPAKANATAPVDREARMARAQGHIERFVREEHGEDGPAVERLVAEGAERLAEEEAFDQMPMSQVVALICSDLQLAPALVARAINLFDEDDERLPPLQYPGRCEVQWLGAPPRPRRRPPPPDEALHAGPPPGLKPFLQTL